MSKFPLLISYQQLALKNGGFILYLIIFYCMQKYLSWIKKTISLSYPESHLAQT